MVESHMRAMVPGVHSHPLSPTYDRIMGWMIRLLEAAGAHPDMGLRLRATFIEAGLPSPSLSLETRLEGGPDADAYRYTIDSLRSMRPMMAKLGIVSLTEEEVNALEARLREEVVASGGVLASPPIAGAWSVKAN